MLTCLGENCCLVCGALSSAEAFKAILLRAILIVLAANVDGVVINEIKLGKRVFCFFKSLSDPCQNFSVSNISIVVRKLTSTIETVQTPWNYSGQNVVILPVDEDPPDCWTTWWENLVRNGKKLKEYVSLRCRFQHHTSQCSEHKIGDFPIHSAIPSVSGLSVV